MSAARSGSDGGRGDGRYIDPAVGLLSGEASGQRARRAEGDEGAAPRPVWHDIPGHDGAAAGRASPTYYNQPVIKEPVWIWSVPTYFYVGGLAGASAALGAVAQGLDRGATENLVRRCRWTAALGTMASAALLVADLGRPERFLNMLRVLRPTSPMSVGSWLLAAVGGFAGAAAGLSGAGGRLRSVGNAAGYAAGLGGLPLAGYTAVLLSTTAVPAWQETRRTLPGLFIASAVSSAAALLDVTALNPREEDAVRRLGLWAKAGELAAMGLVERDVSRIEPVGEPLRTGVVARLWNACKVCAALSLILQLPPGRSRARRAVGAALGTAAAVGVRWAVFLIGKASARDPRATFGQQRAGHGGEEVTGRPAATGPSPRRSAPASETPAAMGDGG